MNGVVLLFLLSAYTLFIPIKEFPDSVLNLDFVRPSERMELAHVNKLTYSAIRLGSVKLYGSGKANCLCYKF